MPVPSEKVARFRCCICSSKIEQGKVLRYRNYLIYDKLRRHSMFVTCRKQHGPYENTQKMLEHIRPCSAGRQKRFSLNFSFRSSTASWLSARQPMQAHLFCYYVYMQQKRVHEAYIKCSSCAFLEVIKLRSSFISGSYCLQEKHRECCVSHLESALHILIKLWS